MPDTDEDLKKRVTRLEITQGNLIDTQERIIHDLKETSESLKKISIDIGILVGTVKSLAETISKQDDFVNRAHGIEVNMQEFVQTVKTVDKMQKDIEDLRGKSYTNSLITKATAFIAASSAITIIGVMINNILL